MFHDCSISVWRTSTEDYLFDLRGSLEIIAWKTQTTLSHGEKEEWELDRVRERFWRSFNYSEHNMSKNKTRENIPLPLTTYPFSEPYLRMCQVRQQLWNQGCFHLRKVIPEHDKSLPFLFWSLIVLRSKFMAVCQHVPVGTGSSVPNWWVKWASKVHRF